MSTATKEVRYDEGEASVVLEDGTLAERGKTVKVSAEMAERLVAQGWTEIKGGKPIDPPPPAPTQAAAELADELGINPEAVDGSGGPNKNQVTVEDVEAFAEAQTAETAQKDAAPQKAGE